MKPAHRIVAGLVVAALATVWFITAGCDGTGRSAGPGLFGPAGDPEKWAIRCLRLEGPDHAQTAEALAGMLRQVKELNARAVRVSSDETGSSVLYGEYRRVPAGRGSDQLVFPPDYQRDIALIRSLTNGLSTPFLGAEPQLVDSGRQSERPEWEATRASATHSLLVAVFYNTEGFQQRKEVAEQYTAMLREEGFTAYYYHEQVKSFVFVGDFNASDVVLTPEGPRPGPRVEQLIARREAEFRYFTQNGHIHKVVEGPDRLISPPTQVVRLPKEKSP